MQGTSTEAELTASRQRLLRDGRTLTRQRRFRDYDATYFVARAELAGNFTTGDVTHRVLIGADTDRFENDQVFLRVRAPSLAGNPTEQQLQAIDIFSPVYGRFPLPTPTPLTNRVEVQKATASTASTRSASPRPSSCASAGAMMITTSASPIAPQPGG